LGGLLEKRSDVVVAQLVVKNPEIRDFRRLLVAGDRDANFKLSIFSSREKATAADCSPSLSGVSSMIIVRSSSDLR